MSDVQFFYEVDPSDLGGRYLCCGGDTKRRQKHEPWLVQSHGWLDGTLLAGTLAEAAARFDPAQPETWPLVTPRSDHLFVGRSGPAQASPLAPLRVPLERLREPSTRTPLLSLVLVRWGGTYRVGENDNGEPEGDGGWGKYGSPPCDWYMSAVIREGVLAHPRLAGAEAGAARDFELFSLFLGGTKAAASLAQGAPQLAACLKGAKKATFWMLWPAEWEDWDTADYAGYVGRHTMFDAMRACERAGIRSSFPHPADQYELITSKAWMATLSTEAQACLPAATMVSKESLLKDSRLATQQALTNIEEIRAKNPFPVVVGDDKAAPSVVNKDGVKKGVVKAGWTWEARFVLFFQGEKQLEKKLWEMLVADGCTVTHCIVQEWVDFDFELRLFFLPSRDHNPEKDFVPVRLEYNGWGHSESGKPGSFSKLTRDKCLLRWHMDKVALEAAEVRATEVAQFLLRWVMAKDPEPVPMLRLDFMLHRVSPGVSRVVFGEFCEMGACCISWEEGPPRIWRAALDYALR